MANFSQDFSYHISSQKDFLIATNALIDERLKPVFANEDDIGQDILHLASRHLCISGNAKRARPLLCLYYHWLFDDKIVDDFVNIGVAAEFIHAASLMHDDIIDQAKKRRGKASVNLKFGNAAAVLAGDYLLTEAFDLLRPFERLLSDRAILAIRHMTRAAMIELNARGKVDIGISVLEEIAQNKTGVLFSWCGFASAICCRRVNDAEHLWNIGEQIGQVFQLADDLKDFDGDNDLKDACKDILNKEPSIPMVLAINQDPVIKLEFQKAFCENSIDNETAFKLMAMIKRSGAIERSRTMMKDKIDDILARMSVYRYSMGKEMIDHWVSELLPNGRFFKQAP